MAVTPEGSLVERAAYRSAPKIIMPPPITSTASSMAA
jgi:hypothetical protein